MINAFMFKNIYLTNMQNTKWHMYNKIQKNLYFVSHPKVIFLCIVLHVYHLAFCIYFEYIFLSVIYGENVLYISNIFYDKILVSISD